MGFDDGSMRHGVKCACMSLISEILSLMLASDDWCSCAFVCVLVGECEYEECNQEL